MSATSINLRSAGIAAVIALSVLAGCSSGDPSQEIEAREAFRLASEGNLTIIDIRAPSEWRETGVGQNVERVSMAAFAGRDSFAKALLEKVDGDHDAPIALIGKAGTRSAKVLPIMQKQGFTNIRHIPEGMLGTRREDGWIAKGLPVEECPQC